MRVGGASSAERIPDSSSNMIIVSPVHSTAKKDEVTLLQT